MLVVEGGDRDVVVRDSAFDAPVGVRGPGNCSRGLGNPPDVVSMLADGVDMPFARFEKLRSGVHVTLVAVLERDKRVVLQGCTDDLIHPEAVTAISGYDNDRDV